MSPLREHRVQQWTLGLSIAGIAVLAASILGQSLYRRQAPVIETATVRESKSVELRVERQGDVLVVRWDPQLASVATATHGLLNVTDGDAERRIGLTPFDLKAGSVRYAPLSRNVAFQLALYDSPVSGSGSVLFLARGEPETSIREPEMPVLLTPRVEKSRERTKMIRPSEDKVRAEQRPVAIARPIEIPPAPPPPEVIQPVVESPVIIPHVQVIAEALAPKPAPPPPPYRVSTTTEPAKGTRLEQVLNRVPFVRRIAKAPAVEDLVQPLRRVDPQVEGSEPLSDPQVASVEIQVDDSGAVKNARLIDLGRAPGNLEWAALRAAKAWRFEAPKDGQSSWLVLNFHFEPLKGSRSEQQLLGGR